MRFVRLEHGIVPVFKCRNKEYQVASRRGEERRERRGLQVVLGWTSFSWFPCVVSSVDTVLRVVWPTIFCVRSDVLSKTAIYRTSRYLLHYVHKCILTP